MTVDFAGVVALVGSVVVLIGLGVAATWRLAQRLGKIEVGLAEVHQQLRFMRGPVEFRVIRGDSAAPGGDGLDPLG